MIYRKLFSVLLLLVSCSCSSQERGLPSDGDLRDGFFSNYSQYQFVKSQIIDNSIYKLELKNNGVLIRPSRENEIEESMLFDSLSKIHVDIVNTRIALGTLEDINEVVFYNYNEGFSFGGQVKGISYSLNPHNAGGLLVDNIDEYVSENWKNKTLVSGHRVYKLLEENWYIFYEYND